MEQSNCSISSQSKFPKLSSLKRLIDFEEKIANLEVSALGVDSKLKLDAMKVMGTHNYYNAAVVGLGIGVDVEAIGSTIEKLRLPLHRMQILCNDNHGITWVNDSKATNFDATYAGLMGLKGRKSCYVHCAIRQRSQ
ncbi:hypothetical protein CsatA_005001 [Cannabis sativa]